MWCHLSDLCSYHWVCRRACFIFVRTTTSQRTVQYILHVHTLFFISNETDIRCCHGDISSLHHCISWLARKDKGSKWPQVPGYQGICLLAPDMCRVLALSQWGTAVVVSTLRLLVTWHLCCTRIPDIHLLAPDTLALSHEAWQWWCQLSGAGNLIPVLLFTPGSPKLTVVLIISDQLNRPYFCTQRSFPSTRERTIGK